MTAAVMDPLAEVPIDPAIAALPKADLHLHQEAKARLDRLVAGREGRPPYDWRGWARRVRAETPPGMGRLGGIYGPDATLPLGEASEDDPDAFVTRVADTLGEGAADGAILVEVRFGADQVLSRPDFMALFREAERRVRGRHPRFRAEAIGYLGLVDDPARLVAVERQVAACLRAARDGLAGVDFRVDPYDTAADPALWRIAYRWAERAADAGLGVTVHAGEFSAANLAAALRVPGLRRLGHAVYAASDERLLERLAETGVAVECSLTCNVVLGAVPSYEDHPIRRFAARGIPVTLNTDLPVHVATSVGREYAVAAALGFTPAELLGFTRDAIRASFTSGERKTALMRALDGWPERI
jgi:hypothetical protein